ncbi:unnamed protein product, partial [marine sediment metagenome]
KFDKDNAELVVEGKYDTETKFVQFDDVVFCPFCLHKDKLTKFRKRVRKGYHKSLGKCPECKQGMQLVSLTTPMNPTQFAEWVYDYPYNYFWRKCSFKKFNSRLHSLGWSYQFWGMYKKLKGVPVSDAYDQYIKDIHDH